MCKSRNGLLCMAGARRISVNLLPREAYLWLFSFLFSLALLQHVAKLSKRGRLSCLCNGNRLCKFDNTRPRKTRKAEYFFSDTTALTVLLNTHPLIIYMSFVNSIASWEKSHLFAGNQELSFFSSNPKNIKTNTNTHCFYDLVVFWMTPLT